MPNNTYTEKEIRSAAILTNSYVAATVLGQDAPTEQAKPVNNNVLVLHLDFTIGSATSAEVKVEFSYDGVNYTQETNAASPSSGNTVISTNAYQMTATGAYTVVLRDVVARYIRVSAKATGTVTGSSLSIVAALSNRM